MADGGQTVDQWDLVELAARRLARALGTGYSWHPDVREATKSGGATPLPPLSSALAISRRGQVTEGAAKSIGGSRHVRRQQEWSKSRGVVAVPSYRLDSDALAALSFAKLDGPLEAILLLYATGDVNRYWPVVKRFGLAVRPGVFGEESLLDAMERLLCFRRSAKTPLDGRAKALGIRASTYRDEVKRSGAMLESWLQRATVRYMNALFR